MPFDRFLIAPFETGLETDLRPWLIPEDAFTQLNNAYVFRGRIKKRFGGLLMGSGATTTQTAPLFSRLRINLGNTDGAGHLTGNVPGVIYKVGQQFSIGTEIFTVQATGTPVVMLTTGGTPTRTYNTTTGAFVFTGAAAATAVYFYPAEPVMGFAIYEVGAINNQPTYAFDTQFAYLFTGGAWTRSQSGGNPVFQGNSAQFFWTTNWEGATPNVKILFVSNFNASIPAAATDDPMWYLNNATWTQFVPYFLPNGGAVGAGPFIRQARVILPFKGRLVLLNTIENDHSGGLGVNTQYAARARYSWYGSPLATQAWYEPNQTDAAGNVAAGGGFVDAATDEAIIGAEFIKDRLIVWFEESVWELAYTGNEIQPFIWQKLNTEYGSQSTFSTIPFDRQILAIGQNGIHACNGSNVERIDQKIPQFVFGIRNRNSGVQRVNGIRDYFTQVVYWTYPSNTQLAAATFNNKVLLYNYMNNSWATNDDCITTFGIFEQQLDQTWASWVTSWQDSNWAWSSGQYQSNFRQVIAGNQQGFTFLVSPDVSRNARVMQLSNITNNGATLTLLIRDHTLSTGDFIAIEHCSGVFGINSDVLNTAYQVTYVDVDNVTIVTPSGFGGVYTGGGAITRVSLIDITSKQWNPYVQEDRNLYLHKIDFGVLRTTNGQITVDYYPSSTELSMLTEAAATGAIIGTGILETTPYALYPLEAQQNRLWHPIYFQTTGECVQINIYLSNAQMANLNIAWDQFQIEGMTLYTTRSAPRLQ